MYRDKYTSKNVTYDYLNVLHLYIRYITSSGSILIPEIDRS